jgi:4,5-dihydroxyphthalate decarboxylase
MVTGSPVFAGDDAEGFHHDGIRFNGKYVSPMSEPLHLRTLLATYPHTAALKSGEVASPRVALDFKDVTPVWSGFKAMVRHSAFDVAEMAVVTYLIAKSFGKPMVLLPAVMTGRIQHAWAIYNGAIYSGERGALTPADLQGKKVGIRSFTTTTGAWLRGMFANDYGLDLASVKWITFEDPHVAEYVDTSKRAPEGKTIIPMLLDGEIDAVLGDRSDDPRVKSLFGDPAAAADAWYQKHRIVPLNHMVVVSASLAKSRPDAVEEVYALLRESKRRAPPPEGIDTTPFGVDACRPALERIIDYAVQQRLIPRRFDVDELFDDTTRRMA